MASMQNTNERLTLLKEILNLGEEVETAFQNAIQQDFKDRESYDVPDKDLDDYFVYQFLHNALSHARSAVLLAENNFPKQLWLIARTTLEGWFYFKSFINKRSLRATDSIARKWRSYHIFQLYQLERKYEGESAAIQMLTDLEDRIGTDIVGLAEKQFDFNKEKHKWHKRPTLKALIEVDGDPVLLRFYESVYSLFSQVQHWDPVTVIATKIDPNPAVGVIFHNILRIILYINEFYELKLDDELNDLYQRFLPELLHESFQSVAD